MTLMMIVTNFDDGCGQLGLFILPCDTSYCLKANGFAITGIQMAWNKLA